MIFQKYILFFSIIASLSWRAGSVSIFEDEDSFIFEELYSHEEEASAQVEENDEEMAKVSEDSESCSTSFGVEGKCMKFKDCYPYMFFGAEGAEPLDVTQGLKDYVLYAAQPCQNDPGVNASDLMSRSDQVICCVSSTLKEGSFPQYRARSEVVEESTTEPEEEEQAVTESVVEDIPEGMVDAQNFTRSSTSLCGLSRLAFDGKIVGGREALKGEFPYIVAIVKNGHQKCGGSLISDRYLVTAAHCLQVRRSSRLNQFSIKIGDHDLSKRNEVPSEQTRGVDRLVIHKGFDGRRLRDDVALMRLDKPIKMNSYVTPICLSNTNSLDGWAADVSGWGQISAKGPQSRYLRTTSLKVLKNDQCQSKYRSTKAPPIYKKMLCAGGLNLPGDACLGDSGGPLAVTSGGRSKLIGIVSWGIGCGSIYPGVYTRVSSYIDWIQKHMK